MLPRGMLASVSLMLVLYPAIVLVVVGNLPLSALSGDPAPVASAAEAVMGRFGGGLISAIAVLALVSMANAGLLSSSRYPFAMARNRLAPRYFAHIYQRTGTPLVSIALTGAVMIALILFVPLLELAKLASAFQVLVFCLIHLSVIAFRESDPPLVPAALPRPPVSVGPGVRNRRFPGAPHPAGLDIDGRFAGHRGGGGGLVPAVRKVEGQPRERHARHPAASVHRPAGVHHPQRPLLAGPGSCGHTGGLRHQQQPAPRPAPYSQGADGRGRADNPGPAGPASAGGASGGAVKPFPAPTTPSGWGAKKIAEEMGLDIAVVRPRGNDTRHALADYADRHAVDLILGEFRYAGGRHREGFDLTWVQDHVRSDVILLGNSAMADVSTITVLGAGSPNDVAKIDAAYRIGVIEQSEVRLLHVLEEDATEPQRKAIQDYHDQLVEMSRIDTYSDIDSSDDLLEVLSRRQRGVDLVIIGASRAGIGPELSQRISDMVEGTVLVVHAAERPAPWRRRLLHRLIY